MVQVAYAGDCFVDICQESGSVVPIEGGRLLNRSGLVDDNGEYGYMGLETSGAESYNRKRTGRYIGGTITDINDTEDFTERTFEVDETEYRVSTIPVHLTL